MRSRLLAAALLASPAFSAPQAVYSLVSVDLVGAAGSGASGQSSRVRLSADGRFVAFESRADNLVAGDTGLQDVFVRDLLLGVTERVSVATSGAAANDFSFGPSISSDGSRVAFVSLGANLAPGNPFAPQAYVRDRISGQTTRVSVSNGGFAANDGADEVWIAGDGGHVLFASSANSLIPGDSNFVADLFVRDLAAGVTERVSVGAAGQQSPQSTDEGAISNDGRYVLFVSDWDALTPGDANGAPDLLLRDRLLGTTTRLPLPVGGLQPGDAIRRPVLSGDGNVVAFLSTAAQLVLGDVNGREDVFTFDRSAGLVELISRSTDGELADQDSFDPTISYDGQRIAFMSRASTLARGDANGKHDVFVRDRSVGETLRVSLTPLGAPTRKHSYNVGLSADGLRVAFASDAETLSALDGNGATDVFVHEIAAAPPQRYGWGRTSSAGCEPTIGWSGSTSLSAPGAFRLRAFNLPPASPGLCFYSLAHATQPFQGGILSVAAPFVRLPVKAASSPPAALPCSGVLDVDFEAWFLSGADPALAFGAPVHAQFWYRDAGDPLYGTGLTDAVRFTLRP